MKTYTHALPCFDHIKLNNKTWLINFAPVNYDSYLKTIHESETVDKIFISQTAYDMNGVQTKDFSLHFTGNVIDVENLRYFWQTFDKINGTNVAEDMVFFYIEGRE